MRFIGDIHGAYAPYVKIISEVQDSVQIGDFGYGFGYKGKSEYIDDFLSKVPGRHRAIRGNHDSLSEISRSSHWIPDGTIENGVMYIGGATSIDKAYRTEGEDWWADEEVDPKLMESFIDKYNSERPHTMVTHEVPEFLVPFLSIGSPFGNVQEYSNTRRTFDKMYLYSYHTPKTWIFGHWHMKVDFQHENTRFICLPINGYIDLEV